MRRRRLALLAAGGLGAPMVPAQPAGAAIGQTGFWIGNCVGEIDVTLTPKPSFTTLAPSVSGSMHASGLSCVVVGLEFSGLLPGSLDASLGNLTSVSCAAGLLQSG